MIPSRRGRSSPPAAVPGSRAADSPPDRRLETDTLRRCSTRSAPLASVPPPTWRPHRWPLLSSVRRTASWLARANADRFSPDASVARKARRRDRVSCSLSHAACLARRVDCTPRCRDTLPGDREGRASSRTTAKSEVGGRTAEVGSSDFRLPTPDSVVARR
jgi:hypothetical protein